MCDDFRARASMCEPFDRQKKENKAILLSAISLHRKNVGLFIVIPIERVRSFV